jgi:protein AbiQ
MSQFSYQICQLTSIFYNNYPNPPYKEILEKDSRAYNCLLLPTHCDYYICVPYRTEIHHKYAYKFKSSQRSRLHNSGLDYTKIVIIQDTSCFNTVNAVIDKDEFIETINNISVIKDGAVKFVEDYIGHIEQTKLLQDKEFYRRYRFSPLKYFHKELNINSKAEAAATTEINQCYTE